MSVVGEVEPFQVGVDEWEQYTLSGWTSKFQYNCGKEESGVPHNGIIIIAM